MLNLIEEDFVAVSEMSPMMGDLVPAIIPNLPSMEKVKQEIDSSNDFIKEEEFEDEAYKYGDLLYDDQQDFKIEDESDDDFDFSLSSSLSENGVFSVLNQPSCTT